ncbi:hypothetical protein ES708_34920 [subsurface metagenome]
MTKRKALTKDDWKLWHEERARFKVYETQGFIADMQRLEFHIMKLVNYAPKDNAGWLVPEALSVIDRLKRDFKRYQRWAAEFLPSKDATKSKSEGFDHTVLPDHQALSPHDEPVSTI